MKRRSLRWGRVSQSACSCEGRTVLGWTGGVCVCVVRGKVRKERV